jgi:hypothetical protein
MEKKVNEVFNQVFRKLLQKGRWGKEEQRRNSWGTRRFPATAVPDIVWAELMVLLMRQLEATCAGDPAFSVLTQRMPFRRPTADIIATLQMIARNSIYYTEKKGEEPC